MAMKELGSSLACSDHLFSLCESFVCQLYNATSQTLNSARHELFVKKRPRAQQLPPTSEALRQHVLRANYQAYRWKHATMPIQAFLSPHGHGWIVSDQPGEDQDSAHGQEVKICWMTLPPAPAALLELVSCKCQAGRTTQRCTCKSAGLKCLPVFAMSKYSSATHISWYFVTH